MKYGRSKEGHRVLKQFDGWSEEEIKQYCIQKAMLDNIGEDDHEGFTIKDFGEALLYLLGLIALIVGWNMFVMAFAAGA